MTVIAVTPGKVFTWSITIITTTLSFQKTTTRLDARHRTKNDSVSRSWTPILEGYYLKLTSWWSTRSFPSLYVDLTNVNERSIQNVSSDRLNKIHYSDHVKSQYSVILRRVTRSWIYFIKQKLRRLIQTNPSFSWRMLDWTMCTHEQFWFLWSSWVLWSNWNENQIIISSSFRISVVLVKWNEKTYLLNIFIYVCSSNASLTWQSTNKKIHQRSWRRSFVFSRKSVI